MRGSQTFRTGTGGGADAPPVDPAGDQLRAVLDRTPVGIMVLDAVRDDDGVIVGLVWRLLNEVGERLIGATQDELRGRPLSQTLPRGVDDQLRQRCIDVARSGQPAKLVVHDVDDGHDRWLRIDVQAGDGGIVASVVDISETKVVEQRLRDSVAVLDNYFTLDIGLLCLAGADGVFRRLGPGWTRALGWSPDELMSAPFIDFVHPDDRDKTIEATKDLSVGGRLVLFENRYRCKDGGYRVLAWSAVGDPEFELIYALAHDVTADRTLTRELRAARDAATAALEQKSQFVANMSHELRTPLNGILGMTELLSGTDLDERQRGWLQLTHDAGRQLLTIFDDILEFSRLERGQVPSEARRTDLAALLHSVTELFMPVAAAKELTLRCSVDQATPTVARVHAARLLQALSNLVGNALKFTHDGGVLLRLQPSAARADAVEFVVRDTGIGIREEDRRRIFEPFVQADISDTRQYGGTGLGLTIAAQLAERMGGTVAVDSTPGRGAAFTLTVPLAPDAPADDTVEASRG